MTETLLAGTASTQSHRFHSSLIVGLALAGLPLLLAGIAFIWTPFDPLAVNVGDRLLPPLTGGHLLGTDHFGRDTLSQIAVGAHSSLLIAAAGTFTAMAVGVIFGAVAAMRGGAADDVVMRSTDIMFAFPAVLLATILASKLGPGPIASVVAIGVWFIPSVARITRASTLEIVDRPYVLVAKRYGLGGSRVFLRHVLPNITGILAVQATTMFGLAILIEAALSFLGLGTQAPIPSWGRMLRDAQGFLATNPLVSVWPGVAIAMTVLGFNVVGDALREFIDPRLRHE